MPHDQAAFDSAAHTETPQHLSNKSSLLAAFKAAGRSLVHRAKHGAGMKVLSAMLLAGAALALPHVAEAQTSYTVTNYGNGDATSINNSGQGAGANQSQPSSTQHPLLFSNGTTTNLGSLGGSAGGEANGINDSTQIVGWSTLLSGYGHAFLYANGTMSDLGTLPTCNSSSRAAAINNAGTIVGWSNGFNANCPITVEFRAFIYSNGVMSDLGTPANQGSVATAINNNGEVVGSLLTYSNLGQQLGSQAFLFNSGTTTTLPSFGGSTNDAYGINNSAQVVGRSTFSNGSEHAFLYSNSTLTDLGALGGADSVAFGINDNGQIVGWAYTTGNASQHAFVFSNGTMTDLNNVTTGLNGDTLYSAVGINNAGQIIAMGLTNNVYVLSPPPPPPAKALGDCGCNGRGDPIDTRTGNVFEQVDDYKTTGQNPLGFTRYYNSLGSASYPGTYASTLGTNWRSNFDRYLNVISSSSVAAERPDGQVVKFALVGSTWTPDTDVDMKLVQNGSTWTLTDHNDNVETYNVTGSKGTLQTIEARDGYTQTLYYTSGQLTSVTDSYSRSLNFTYSGGLLETLSTPDGLSFTYGFTPKTGGNALTSVTYSTTPTTDITYQYGNASFPFALTGVLDENNQQFSSWTYDTQGRGHTSQRGSGADLTTVTFNSGGTTTVTNAFGVADTYTFTTLQGVPKMTQISRAATSTTAAASRTFGYDSFGFVNSATDWNGNHTTYVNNAQGNPTTINYAVGSPVAYSVTLSYDPIFTHLPHQIVAPGLTSTFVYDGSGNPLNRTDLDTTTNSIPYSTNGQTREFQWTWNSTGEKLTEQLPRTDVVAKTTWGYDATGALTSIKDALNHTTNITQHTGGGLPQTIVDPNNVTTTLAYDGRLNLHTSTIQTGAGNLTTTWTYDPANNLQSVQKPDGSTLTFGYDPAHRLTSITDLFNNTTTYMLDALGDKTLIQVKNASATLTQQHSGVFDALGRVTSDIGGMSQTTVYTYDNMGNALTITPPSPQGQTTQTFDALNRLSTRTDPSPGGTTTTTYNSFNHVLSVKDANNNTTSYVYDGFGDRTQTASPDSGTTVFTYDPDRNLTKAALPGSITKNYTFDALDRTLTVKYTGDTTLNVTNTYDQAGHGFGIGRLTSATDKIGSLSLAYDERGNVTQEVRTPTGLAAQTTSYGYDAASNIASITYPSTTFAQYGRDIMGRVTSVTAKPPGASSASNIATGITYEPFGPVTGLTFGNGITGTYGYDLDYRPTTRVDAGTATVQNLTYAYFANNSVQTITDAVNAANTQNMTYDTLDRLKTAASGSGGYGSFSWTWDAVSNVKTHVVNGTTTTFSYTTGTNKMSKFVTGSTTDNVTTSASGNITTFKVGSSTVESLTYDKANQLATAAASGQSATYTFDLYGRRIKEVGTVTGTTIYAYDRNNNLLADNDGAGTNRVDYIYLNPGTGPGSRPVGTVQPSNSKIYFLHTDRLGTPTVATDSNKVVQWSALYQPFGYTSTGMSGIVQNIRFPGQEWDLESTYNHNGFRDYAATLTRYVQTDPIGLAGGMNTYQYAGGNPFKYTDRRGLDSSFPNGGQPVTIGDSAPGVASRIRLTQHGDNQCNTPLAGAISKLGVNTSTWQSTQDVLEFLKNYGPWEVDGLTENADMAIDRLGDAAKALTNNIGSTANAYRYYSNPAAKYDPTGNPGGWTTNPIEPDTSSWTSKFARWFNDKQQQWYNPNQQQNVTPSPK